MINENNIDLLDHSQPLYKHEWNECQIEIEINSACLMKILFSKKQKTKKKFIFLRKKIYWKLAETTTTRFFPVPNNNGSFFLKTKGLISFIVFKTFAHNVRLDCLYSDRLEWNGHKTLVAYNYLDITIIQIRNGNRNQINRSIKLKKFQYIPVMTMVIIW